MTSTDPKENAVPTTEETKIGTAVMVGVVGVAIHGDGEVVLSIDRATLDEALRDAITDETNDAETQEAALALSDLLDLDVVVRCEIATAAIPDSDPAAVAAVIARYDSDVRGNVGPMHDARAAVAVDGPYGEAWWEVMDVAAELNYPGIVSDDPKADAVIIDGDDPLHDAFVAYQARLRAEVGEEGLAPYLPAIGTRTEES